MSRIRTIKPEFPQSETIGHLSRDARLLFVQLWTIADDSGKARAASRMLASLLYPYDDDAPSLIEGWLTELEEHECVRRYQAEGGTYLEIINWLKHQKIDKPSKSKIPPFDEASRIVAKPREASATDLVPGPRTLDQDQGPSSLRSDGARKRASRLPNDWVPTSDDFEFAHSREFPHAQIKIEAEKFRNYWTAKAGKDAAKLDWPATWRNWILNAIERTEGKGQSNGTGPRGSGPRSAAGDFFAGIAEVAANIGGDDRMAGAADAHVPRGWVEIDH